MTKFPRVPERKNKNKEKISATIDNAVGEKIREIMPAYYYNYSETLNAVLKEGLKSMGYEEIEA